MSAETPATPEEESVSEQAWPTDEERETARDKAEDALREDHGGNHYGCCFSNTTGRLAADVVLEALTPLVAAREAAAYARGRAEAWEAGYEAGTNDVIAQSAPPGPNGPTDPTPNPYDRATQKEYQ